MKKLALWALSLFFMFCPGNLLAASYPETGFLVLAPDRGFLGNSELEVLFTEFEKEYPAALVYVGQGHGGPDRDYAPYIDAALARLQNNGAERVVAIPLFLSGVDPALVLARQWVAEKAGGRLSVRWAEPMAASHLTAQVFLDRARQLSGDPENERLILLGMGPVDETSEQAMRAELQPVLQYATDRLPFREAELVLYYGNGANAELRERKEREADRKIFEMTAKKGHTLLIPFVMAAKYSHQMSVSYWLTRKFGEYDLTVVPEEIVPHPNVLHWLRKTANRFTAPAPSQVGVVVMPHGAQKPYNDAIEKVIEPLKSRYRVEIAYGMADALILQDAVAKLEREGIRKIVVVRMYSLENQFKDKIDYLLGFSTQPPRQRPGATPPPQVRSGAVFASFGGYEEDALICEILRERVMSISRDPRRERVLLVAHGARDDKKDAEWKAIMQKHADYIQQHAQVPFREVRGLTVREDWPDKKEGALKNIRTLIEEGSASGRTLIISNRLYGSGRYDEFFNGLVYEMNREGLAPHPNLTRWLEQGIEATLGKGFGEDP
ncbi:MAG: hypothetical protein KC553_00535 [Nitrospina sp.]|nr:hypothetical protein [Nitrospina sp.]